MMAERQRIEKAIAAQESLRATVGDEIVDETISMLRRELAHLETPEQQRKLVTILFADVVGSTNIVKHLDPEDALEIMDGSLKRLAVPVEQHGGHVARFMGDGFKAVFGAAVAQENDPEMAIRAGLDILEAAQDLGVELDEERSIHDFQVRVGINSGLAALGGVTEAEDTVMGSTVNLAKRVESAASGGLLISHNTYRHVRGIFSVRHHEPIEAKGFDRPVPVYLVLGVKPRAFRVRTRGVEGIETRMVGREAELLILQNAYRDAIEGKQTQVITVIGEAGVGKSRLLYEFGNWIELLPPPLVRFFQGRGRQETQNLPYALLKDVFTFRFYIQESDKSIEVHKKLEDGFCEVLGAGAEGQMRAHIIGQLLGFDFSESQHVKGIIDDPQQIHDRALMYLAEFFQVMSEQSPVVIFLEDIHWADDSSLDMLNRLVRRIPEQCLLVVCVARNRLYERRPHWGEGLAYHRRLELQPLTKHDSSQLVTEILQKVDQIPESLQELVVIGAEGNPFYIEELIKMLVEDGIIITGEEKWQIEPERLAVVDVPDTLTGVLQARLEGLPQEERNTLQQASVVGQIFWDDTVEYITNESSPADTKSALHSTDENLFSLRARELIYHREESTFTNVAEYTFKHALMRDVTYESVLRRVRKAYHGLVAEWLIQHGEERAGEYAGLIADHLELAGKTEQAAIYLYQAGEEAAKRYANDEAVHYFSSALALTPEDDLVGRYDLLLEREKILDYQGDRDAQFADLTELKGIANSLKDVRKLAQVTGRELNYFHSIDDYQSVIELVEQAIHLAQKASDVACEAEVNLLYGMFLWPQGEFEAAIIPLERALSLSQIHHLDQVEADSLRVLGIVYGRLGDLDKRKSFYVQALGKSRQIGYLRGEADALNNLGNEYFRQGDFQNAREYYKRALHINRKSGNRYGEANVLGNLGFNERWAYDHYKAIDFTYQTLAIYCEIGGRSGELSQHNSLGFLNLDIGEHEKAISHFKQAKTIANQINNIDAEYFLILDLMSIYSELGDFKRATYYYEQVKKVRHELESPFDRSFYTLWIGFYMHQIGNSQAGEEYCRQSFQFIGDQEDRLQQWYRLITLAIILEERGKLTEACEIYQGAVSLGYQMNLPRHALEAQAGLARISLASGETEQALILVNYILVYMIENTQPSGSSYPLDGMFDPFRVLLTCYQVLKANDDKRVDAILTEAYNLLQTRAANISDEQLRSCFLNNVAVNREIVEEYEAMSLDGGVPS